MKQVWSGDDVTADELMSGDRRPTSATSEEYLAEADRMRAAVERQEDDACMPLLPEDDDVDEVLAQAMREEDEP